MSAALDTSTLVEVVVASGLLTALSETVRWFTSGRGRQRVDNAKIVQGMALDLITPLHTEVDGLRAKLSDLAGELDSVLGYAIIAHALLETPPVRKTLDANGLKAPVPPPAVKDRAGNVRKPVASDDDLWRG